MAISLRSFFGKGGSDKESAVTVATQPEQTPISPPTSAGGSGASPFGGLLFKTAAPGEPLGHAVNAAPSPFATTGATPSTGLTIGDLLAALPPDLAKHSGHSLEMPVLLPESVIDAALGNGRAAVPVFEVFRACPALFQFPVGPHDTREVALPTHKIPYLLAAHASSPAVAASMNSPFSVPAMASPFSVPHEPPAAMQSENSSTLFHPSPFGMVQENPAPTPQSSASVDRATPAMMASPFQAASSPFGVGQPETPSPFTVAPAFTASSPFSIASEPVAAAPPSQPVFTQPSAPSSFADLVPPVPAMPAASSPFQMAAETKAAPVDGFFQVLSAPTPAPLEAISPFAAFQPPTSVPPQDNAFPSAPAAWNSVPHAAASIPPAAVPTSSFGAPDFSAMSQSNDPMAGLFSAAITPPPAAAAGIAPGFAPNIFSEPSPSAPKQGEAAPSSLFPSAPAVNPSANPFQRIQALSQPAETAPAASPSASFAFHPDPAPSFASASSVEPQAIHLGLAAALKSCPAHELGTSPENLPTWVKFTLPLALVEPHLSKPSVTIPLETILEGLEPPIRAIFNKARPGLQVEIPINEIFHSLPAPGKDAPVRSAAQAFTMPEPEKFAPTAPDYFVPVQPPAPNAVTPFWSEIAKPELPQPDVFDPRSSQPIEPVVPVFVPPLETQTKTESVFIPANPVTGAEAFVAPAPKPPVETASVSTTTRDENTTRRLMMAVLLGAPDASDVPTIVRLTRSLAGVSAVVCLKDGQILAEGNDGSAEAARFVRALPEKIRSVSEISNFLGEYSAAPETIHLQLDRGQITISLQENITFAVLHDPQRSEPALREKITLLGREVAALIRESAPR